MNPDDALRQHPAMRDADGVLYRMAPFPINGTGIPRLRWVRADAPAETMTLRQVVERMECYEPAMTLTAEAVKWGDLREDVSVSELKHERQTVEAAAIVLNTALRAAVVAEMRRGSNAETIAMRCGVMRKHGRAGDIRGDASWLLRRVGLRRDSGGHNGNLTRWVHSHVLTRIARDGLGIAPREVEYSERRPDPSDLVIPRRARRQPRTCRWGGGCDADAGHGTFGAFCEEHAERLGAIEIPAPRGHNRTIYGTGGYATAGEDGLAA